MELGILALLVARVEDAGPGAMKVLGPLGIRPTQYRALQADCHARCEADSALKEAYARALAKARTGDLTRPLSAADFAEQSHGERVAKVPTYLMEQGRAAPQNPSAVIPSPARKLGNSPWAKHQFGAANVVTSGVNSEQPGMPVSSPAQGPAADRETPELSVEWREHLAQLARTAPAHDQPASDFRGTAPAHQVPMGADLPFAKRPAEPK
ncbi:MAG: hypothetical protein EXR75_06455 [Myxococcales bacterium]|nr:hypothetical protein [Myxococcales bacterium]